MSLLDMGRPEVDSGRVIATTLMSADSRPCRGFHDELTPAGKFSQFPTRDTEQFVVCTPTTPWAFTGLELFVGQSNGPGLLFTILSPRLTHTTLVALFRIKVSV